MVERELTGAEAVAILRRSSNLEAGRVRILVQDPQAAEVERKLAREQRLGLIDVRQKTPPPPPKKADDRVSPKDEPVDTGGLFVSGGGRSEKQKQTIRAAEAIQRLKPSGRELEEAQRRVRSGEVSNLADALNTVVKQRESIKPLEPTKDLQVTERIVNVRTGAITERVNGKTIIANNKFVARTDDFRGRVERFQSRLETRAARATGAEKVLLEGAVFTVAARTFFEAPLTTVKAITRPKETIKQAGQVISDPKTAGATLGRQLETRPAATAGSIAGTVAFPIVAGKIVKEVAGTAKVTTPKGQGVSFKTITVSNAGKTFQASEAKGLVLVKPLIGKTKKIPFEARAVETGIKSNGKVILTGNVATRAISGGKSFQAGGPTVGVSRTFGQVTETSRLSSVVLQQGQVAKIGKVSLDTATTRVISNTPKGSITSTVGTTTRILTRRGAKTPPVVKRLDVLKALKSQPAELQFVSRARTKEVITVSGVNLDRRISIGKGVSFAVRPRKTVLTSARPTNIASQIGGEVSAKTKAVTISKTSFKTNTALGQFAAAKGISTSKTIAALQFEQRAITTQNLFTRTILGTQLKSVRRARTATTQSQLLKQTQVGKPIQATRLNFLQEAFIRQSQIPKQTPIGRSATKVSQFQIEIPKLISTGKSTGGPSTPPPVLQPIPGFPPPRIPLLFPDDILTKPKRRKKTKGKRISRRTKVTPDFFSLATFDVGGKLPKGTLTGLERRRIPKNLFDTKITL